MEKLLMNYLIKNNISIQQGDIYAPLLFDKILILDKNDYKHSLIRGFTEFFCTIIRNSHIEKRAFGKISEGFQGEKDKVLIYREIIKKEVYARLLQAFKINPDYRSEYPQLYRFIVKTLYRLDELNLYTPLDRTLSFQDAGELITQVAKDILKSKNYVMTGSFALSLQGSIYRNYNAESGLHDVDIISNKTIYEMMQYIDTLKYNVIKVYHNHRKIICLIIPDEAILYEYLIKNGSLVYYTIHDKEGKEIGGFEYSQQRGRFVKWGCTSLLLDFVHRPLEQINKAIPIVLEEQTIKVEHYRAILDVKIQMDRLKDSMDYAVFKPSG
jgi:hypothetical protein